MTLLFLLEERSAEAFLRGLLPRIVPDEVNVQYRVFEGKQDLEKRLVVQLREWRLPNTRFVVLRDQDSADCRVVKARLKGLCERAGRPDALVRIACHTLESWYLGDLAGVEEALGVSGLARRQRSAVAREPDRTENPDDELGRMTKDRFQKVSGARRIGPAHRDRG